GRAGRHAVRRCRHARTQHPLARTAGIDQRALVSVRRPGTECHRHAWRYRDRVRDDGARGTSRAQGFCRPSCPSRGAWFSPSGGLRSSIRGASPRDGTAGGFYSRAARHCRPLRPGRHRNVTSTAMSDTDAHRRSEPAGAASERTNLPVPVPRASEIAPEGGMAWFARLLRTFLGWKTNSIRADLEVVLEAGAAAESGFSPEERAMLKNILGLRERGVEDVMVPRADIVAVQKDIPLGELVKVFEVAAHSRLVVYDDTLDDPTGMVHIRDLIAYMANRAAASASTKPRRKKPFTAGLDLNAVDLSVPLSSTKLVRTILFVPPSMPAIDLLAKMQATRIHLALV